MKKIITEQRAKVLEGAITAFNHKGLKFTMDDLAAILGMSKKTIYKLYRDKEEMFSSMVEYSFNKIKESEAEIFSNDKLSTIDKLTKILGVLPERYLEIDLRQLYLLREKYPDIYIQIEERLENGWENTIALLEQGMKEGVIRPVNVALFKMMFEASIERFFQRDILVSNGISYAEALNEVVAILINGITAKEGD